MYGIARCGLLILLCVALTSCTSTPAQSGLECGAVAGLLVLAVCEAAEDKGKDDHCEEKAAAAIAVAGAACFVYAKNLEQRRAALAGKEDDLNAQIQYVRGLNQDTRVLNATLAKSVEQAAAETELLLAAVKRNEITQEQLAQERQARDDAIKASRQQIADGKEALQVAKDFRSRGNPGSGDLDTAIAEQERLLADAQRQVELLVAQRARV